MTETRVLAIVPAAGQSSRLGQPKQLIEYQGKTLLARCVDAVQAVCPDLLVVTGAYREQVIATLAPPTPSVHNPDWRAGLGASLACGVARAAAGAYDAVLVVLPDQPLIDENDLQRLLAESRSHPGQVVCAGYAGTRGVPAILPRRLFDDVLALRGDRGAHDIIAGEPDVRVIPMATAAVDIDTPADLGHTVMISVAQAWQHIRECLTPCSTARVSVDDAAGAVLAQPVTAERDQPPFDRVMMDGIALDADALDAGLVKLERQGVQAAGAPRQKLAGKHQYIEIMTGAVVPTGADTIVPVEALEFSGGQVTLKTPDTIERGQFIHRQGSDYEAGVQLLTPGTRLRGPEMAVLASSGLAQIEVALPPSVAIIAVGDELVDPGVPISDVQIRRSNDYAIDATLSRHGVQVPTRLTLPDDPQILQRRIGDAIDTHDMVVLSGGVSMGKFDYIPGIMRTLGVRIALHKVAQKPGKPMWIGNKEETVVFALPGNPVSALTCARRYVLPAIATAMGERVADEYIQLGAPARAPAELTWFPPVVMAGDGQAHPKTLNTSGDFHGLAGTAGFVEIPAGAALDQGDVVRLWRW